MGNTQSETRGRRHNSSAVPNPSASRMRNKCFLLQLYSISVFSKLTEDIDVELFSENMFQQIPRGLWMPSAWLCEFCSDPSFTFPSMLGLEFNYKSTTRSQKTDWSRWQYPKFCLGETVIICYLTAIGYSCFYRWIYRCNSSNHTFWTKYFRVPGCRNQMVLLLFVPSHCS